MEKKQKNYPKNYKQDKKAADRVDLLNSTNQAFADAIEKMRQEWMSFEPEPGNEGEFFYNFEHHSINQDTDKTFKEQILNILKKYRLNPIHEKPIANLIIKGSAKHEIRDLDLRKEPYLIHRINSQDILIVPIYQETTIKDLQEQWPEIKEAKDKFYKNKRKKIVIAKNRSRDLHVVYFKKQGKTDKEITRLINQKYPKSLIGPADVHKIVKRARDRAR